MRQVRQGGERRAAAPGAVSTAPRGAPDASPLREPATDATRYRRIAEEVLRTEAAAIEGLLAQLDDSFTRAVEVMRACRGRIVCTGMGKSGHVMKKVAATLASTGSPSLFVHPAEAIHGDLGMIVEGDVALAASSSGTTDELLRLLPALHHKRVALIAITGNPKSPLAEQADVHLSAAIDREACPLNLAPTASTTVTLALGDALAMALLEARGFTSEDFASLHPGGQLGRRLLRVGQVMHRGDAVPRVTGDTALRDAIYEMSKKGLGITAVTDRDERLVGVISDGDLRRLLEHAGDEPGLLSRTAERCMKTNPRAIAADALALEALERMEEFRITSLFVTAADGTLDGIVHLHDLWGLKLRPEATSP